MVYPEYILKAHFHAHGCPIGHEGFFGAEVNSFLNPRLLHDRDQCALRQLRAIGHCHDQISLLIPEVNMAAGLTVDLEAEMLQSFKRVKS
jgi:hypothetical protein